MCLSSGAFGVAGQMAKEKELPSSSEKGRIAAFDKELELTTKFIPLWVKICGRAGAGPRNDGGLEAIVVTVSEKIGKAHLTYGRARRPNRGLGYDRGGRRIRAAGQHNAHPVLRHRRHDGGQGSGMQGRRSAEHRAGVGADAAGGDDPRPVACSSSSGRFIDRPSALRG